MAAPLPDPDAPARLDVAAATPAGLGDEARDGWEIGLLTRALLAGPVEVVGVDPRRLQRVRAVVAALQAGGLEGPR